MVVSNDVGIEKSKGKKKVEKRKSIILRLKEEDKEELKVRAEQAGISINEFIFRCATGKKLPKIKKFFRVSEEERSDFELLMRVLKKISMNINDLANLCADAKAMDEFKSINFDDVNGVARDLKDILKDMKEIL